MGVRVRSIVGTPGPMLVGDLIEIDEKVARQLVQREWVEAVDESCADPLYQPWPIQGCTLHEALKRTTDPELWNSWVTAGSELAAAGGPVRRRTRSFGIFDEGPTREQRLAKREERHRDSLEARAKDAESKIYLAFVYLLSEGMLVAQGSYKAPSATPCIIRSGAWKDIGIKDLKRSIAVERTPEKACWYDIRVFPALHSPDAPVRLAGLSIREVFHRFVFADIEVIASAKRRMPTDRFEMIFGDRKFCRLDELKWPLDCAGSPYAYRPIAIKSFWESEQSSEVTTPLGLVADVIEDRLKALEALLATGHIEAIGTFSTGNLGAIGRLEWLRRGTWIDLRNSDLVEEAKERRCEVRWTGIGVGDVAPTNSTWGALSQASGGYLNRDISRETERVPPTAVADGVLTTLTPNKAVLRVRSTMEAYESCYEWLRQAMDGSKNKKVGTKLSWRKQAKSKWKGALSDGRFDEAWAAAVRDSGAEIWSAAGAPRKSK